MNSLELYENFDPGQSFALRTETVVCSGFYLCISGVETYMNIQFGAERMHTVTASDVHSTGNGGHSTGTSTSVKRQAHSASSAFEATFVHCSITKCQYFNAQLHDLHFKHSHDKVTTYSD
jgi:hypothetical protein